MGCCCRHAPGGMPWWRRKAAAKAYGELYPTAAAMLARFSSPALQQPLRLRHHRQGQQGHALARLPRPDRRIRRHRLARHHRLSNQTPADSLNLARHDSQVPGDRDSGPPALHGRRSPGTTAPQRMRAMGQLRPQGDHQPGDPPDAEPGKDGGPVESGSSVSAADAVTRQRRTPAPDPIRQPRFATDPRSRRQ
jgi:hypothetical protein